MRFLHTADWHVGASDQHNFYLKISFQKLIEYCDENKITDIIVAGDVFDKHPVHLSDATILFELFLSAPAIKFYLTVGNHDYVNKLKSSHALEVFHTLQLPNVIVCEPGHHSFEEFDLIVLDHLDDPFERTEKPTVGVFHGVVPGYEFSGSNKQVTIPCASAVDYLALGDIHQMHRFYDNCYYSGTLFQKSYADTSGVIDVTLGDKAKAFPVALEVPKKITLCCDLDIGKDAEQDIVDFVREHIKPGNLAKLKFTLPLKVWGKIDKAKVKDVLSEEYPEVKFSNEPDNTSVSRENLSSVMAAKGIDEELRFVIKETFPDLDQELLLETCLESCK